MTTLILGLNAYHWDASAALIADGTVVAAVPEERLGLRVKHQPGFPRLAAAKVLSLAGVELADLDYLAVGYNDAAHLGKRARYALSNPMRAVRNIGRFAARRSARLDIADELIDAVGGSEKADRGFEVVHVEHHLAHIASSFYTSPFQRAAALSYDAAGDFVTAMYATCDGTRIDVIDRVHVPHSLGYFYTALCQFIGFDRVGEEYKVMGLAAYGTPRYSDVMGDILALVGEGQFRINEQYIQLLDVGFDRLSHAGDGFALPPLYTEALIDRLGPPRPRGAPITQRDKDIAASCQHHFETTVVELVRWLHSRVPAKSLVLAGGCALNGVTNARIMRDTPFDESYIHSAATDDGLSIGAAMWVWHNVAGGSRSSTLVHPYLGEEYADTDLERALSAAGLESTRLERGDLLDRTASHLSRGHIVGWFQGRYEWGPRALGNRSILAHPGWPGMKDLVNRKIKRRESFRPFAPSILADRVAEYFEQDIESPFMMHVVKIREEKRQELAAVCHEDGTGRLHTVTREQNALYYDLVSRFAELSGTPALLNTSFNENEPIVDTPEQAIATFQRNDIDVLVLNDFIVEKSGLANPS